MEPMIEAKNLHKYFGELHVLQGVSLDVSNGVVVSIIGASGSGKSTLLCCINGLPLLIWPIQLQYETALVRLILVLMFVLATLQGRRRGKMAQCVSPRSEGRLDL